MHFWYSCAPNTFQHFWHRNLRVEWSPQHLTPFVWIWLFSVTSPAVPVNILHLICVELIHTSMPLSSPEFTTSRVCISLSHLWSSTTIMKNKQTNKQKVLKTSQIFQRWIRPLVKQHSLVLLFLIFLSIPRNLLICIVPSSLTLQFQPLFSSFALISLSFVRSSMH